ncbi:hypothetical protein LP419_03800 [Massilia sp. H-1]|nr:hypothetical protein LP419_03800 [Massilia sp. H-1]
MEPGHCRRLSNTAPFEGSNVIAWNYNSANQWFGGSIQSRQVHDMSGFRNGNVKLKIKMLKPTSPSTSGCRTPTPTRTRSISRPTPPPTGWCATASGARPRSQYRRWLSTKVALQSMLDLFQISSDAARLPTAPFQFAIDDIVWDSGTVVPTPDPNPDPDADPDANPDADSDANADPNADPDAGGQHRPDQRDQPAIQGQHDQLGRRALQRQRRRAAELPHAPGRRRQHLHRQRSEDRGRGAL